MRATSQFPTFILAAALLLAGCRGASDAELLAPAKDYLHKRDTAAAIVELKDLLQQEPSLAEARFLLGQALLESGDAAGAEVELRRALELKHDAAIVTPLLARALLRQGAFGKLTDTFAATVLDDAKAMAELQVTLAEAYTAQGDTARAGQRVAKALALQPAAAAPLLAQARMQAAAADYDAALATLDKLLAGHADSVEGWKLKGAVLARARPASADASAAYEKALALQPGNADLHASLISLHFAHKDLAAAQRQFDAMQAALPGAALTRFYAAQLLFARADYKGAQQALQQLLAEMPENLAVLSLAGATALKLRAPAAAEAFLHKAVLLQPKFEAARRLLAQAQLQQGQPQRALVTLRPVLDAAEAQTLLVAGQAALAEGDHAAADGYFGKAAAAAGSKAGVTTARALAQLAQGHAAEALEALQAIASSDTEGASADLALISARLAMGDHAGAAKAIDALEKKQPGSALAAELRGRVSLQRRDAPLARKNFEAALQRDPRYLPALMKLAALDTVQGKPEAAQARLAAYLKGEPRSVPVLLALATLKQRSGGTPDEVAALLKAAVDAVPDEAQPRLALVDHYLAGGDAKAALTAAQAAAAALPADPDVQDKLARAQLASGDVNQAASIFGRLATQQPDLALGHMGLAETSLAKKDFAAAYDSARRVLELAPRAVGAQRLAVLAAMGAGRPQDALAVVRDMQTQRPRDALGFILEGEIELGRQRSDAAAAAFRKALTATNPAQAPARLHAALLQAKKDAEARRFADGWLHAHPRDALFLYYLGSQAATQGEHAAAERHYRALLQVQPRNAIALNNLADLLLRQGKPGALALAEQANQADPGRPALMDTLAGALAAERQYAKAIEVQKQAIAKAPDADVFKLNLARIHLQAGDAAQARSQLRALLDSGRDFPQRAEASALLQSVPGS